MHTTPATTYLRQHARIVLAMVGALLVGLVSLVALGAIGLDTAAGGFCGVLLGSSIAVFLLARGTRTPAGESAKAREDAGRLDHLEPLAPKRS